MYTTRNRLTQEVFIHKEHYRIIMSARLKKSYNTLTFVSKHTTFDAISTLVC